MTADYVATKIREALDATDQDKRDAQKLLITWAVRDQALLLGLTKPHLKGIIAAQIDHATAETKGGDKQGKTHFTIKDAQAMAASKPLGDKRSHLPPPKSSVRQASVMHQIAAAFKKEKSSKE